ncbi:MAG TPA: hypothetical protein PLF73_08385, partial [Luteimonas sp.]|nr:hypothetical protein [Luteimonas sp.]
LTIGLAGMDPATEAALKAAFHEANERLAGRFQLLAETQAEHVVVDMDSMYGPMSWLRLHASGKRVIGLTAATRSQTDFRLGRPFSVDAVAALLQEIAGEGVAPAVVEATPEPEAATKATEAIVEAEPPAPDAIADPAPPAPLAPPEPPAPAQVPEPTPAPTPATASTPEPAPTDIPAATPADIAPPGTLFGWLSSGTLRGRLRYRRPSGPNLLIDADARSYHGPAALKPLAQYFEGEVALEDFETLDAATWERESGESGEAQSLSRLLWLGALLTGKGQLLPGLDPEAKYQLTRWPQTEREFPRHFRIATAMMKGPAVLADVAEASGIALEEIIDFVNASLATGVAEVVPEPPPEPVAPPRSGGLLGRLRGR